MTSWQLAQTKRKQPNKETRLNDTKVQRESYENSQNTNKTSKKFISKQQESTVYKRATHKKNNSDKEKQRKKQGNFWKFQISFLFLFIKGAF